MMERATIDRNIWSRKLREGDEILVERGNLWLTVGASDVLLQTGQRFRLSADAEVMGQSLAIGGESPHVEFRLYLRASNRQTGLHLGQHLRERFAVLSAFHPLG